ncbi:MAG: phosphoglycerate mutase [Myxococcaceae bacterium]|nr:phosphoglycerate mutase [Myxococcaceae bacterium]MEA2746993.1 hypothetical protein [Myxococcales bacterium]
MRHGESAGNVARDAAEAAGLPTIDLDARDVDVPLSPLGEQQARALGRWFAQKPEAERPTVVLVSPYVRAKQTAELVIESGHVAEASRSLAHVIDERLREKEFGSFNRLTRAGILAKFPDQAELYTKIGKLYYRPPGGESWCDVILRLRSVIDHMKLEYRGERVLVVAHQVIVLCFRYVLEQMDEAQLLAIARAKDVANCGVTFYELEADAGGNARAGMSLRLYNFVTPLEEAGAPVTKEPDEPPVRPR